MLIFLITFLYIFIALKKIMYARNKIIYFEFYYMYVFSSQNNYY